jgi:hypothetical protein
MAAFLRPCRSRQEVLSPIYYPRVAVFARRRVFHHMYIPDEAGLGVTLNGACAQKYQVKSCR